MRSTAGCAGATLARDVPFSALYWSGLEPIRKALLPANALPSQAQVMTANFVAGTVGGGLAAAVTTPLDVVKTRLQVLATSLRFSKGLMCAYPIINSTCQGAPSARLQQGNVAPHSSYDIACLHPVSSQRAVWLRSLKGAEWLAGPWSSMT